MSISSFLFAVPKELVKVESKSLAFSLNLRFCTNESKISYNHGSAIKMNSVIYIKNIIPILQCNGFL